MSNVNVETRPYERERFFGQGEQIAGTSYYFIRDHLGSVREVTDASNVLRARYDYDLYGQRSVNQVTSNPIESDFGFTGHYLHVSSGLYFAPFRAYSASLGRWLNRDPIGEKEGTSLYEYVENSPVNYIDALGLKRWVVNNLGASLNWVGKGGRNGKCEAPGHPVTNGL